MEFLITAYDETDTNAMDRRLAARGARVDLESKMIAEGTLLYTVAILDDAERTIGSSMVVDFPSRVELDEWLRVEPYVTGGVWAKIDVQSCRLGEAGPCPLGTTSRRDAYANKIRWLIGCLVSIIIVLAAAFIIIAQNSGPANDGLAW